VKTQSQKSKLLVQLMWYPPKIHYGPLSVKAFCSQWVVFHKVLFWTALWGIVIGPCLQSPSTPLVPIYTCFQILSREVWVEQLTARFLSLHNRGLQIGAFFVLERRSNDLNNSSCFETQRIITNVVKEV
jgi:hypothetical protein